MKRKCFGDNCTFLEKTIKSDCLFIPLSKNRFQMDLISNHYSPGRKHGKLFLIIFERKPFSVQV
jgi:hypothetical protein